MKKILFITISLFSFLLKGQSFPYLNASTGNEGEFPVDKDTNIFMCYTYGLIKTDKNLNKIWAKTTGNFLIRHLLLSKTGSMYFIAGVNFKNFIGKIDQNGHIVWLISFYPTHPSSTGIPNFKQTHSLLLDRNDQLVISGTIQNSSISESGFFLKLDTNGVLIKLRKIDGPLTSNFSIAYDSSGYYKFIGGSSVVNSPPNQIAMTTYDDINDQIVNTKLLYSKTGGAVISWRYLRSKFNNNFYIHLSYVPNGNAGIDVGLLKCNMSGVPQWNLFMNGFDDLPNTMGFSRSAVESSSGNLFFQHDGGTYSTKYKSGIFRIDSAGNTNGIGIKIVDDYPNLPSPYHYPQSIDNNRHFIDVKTPSTWTSDPIELITFNNALTSPCSLTTTCNYSLHPASLVVGSYTQTSQPLQATFTPTNGWTSYTYNSPVLYNNCTYIGITRNSIDIEFNISPNPVKSILNLNTSNHLTIEKITITTLNGKTVLEMNFEKSINVSNFIPGVYILKLKTSEGIYHRKFIKE
jgi:hypothetical protein